MSATTKIAYNACFGGFGLSAKALLRLHELGCEGIATPIDEYWGPDEKREKESGVCSYNHAIKKWREYVAGGMKERSLFITVFTPDEKHVLTLNGRFEDNRANPLLIQVIEELGEEANGACANLKIVELPKGALYRIEEYDGSETVATNDGYEWKVA